MLTREKKSRAVKEKIMDIARDLIIAQGYKKTTIRQIIEKAGVSTGTLYHFFLDKEDIFLHLAAQAYTFTMQVADNITEYKNDPVLRYALTRVLELKAAEKDDAIAEMLLDVHGSWRITKRVLPVDIEKIKSLFQQYNKDFSYADYYVRTLTLRGMRASLITERVYERAGNFEARWPFMVEAELLLFNVPKPVIEKTIQKIKKVIDKNVITIGKFTV